MTSAQTMLELADELEKCPLCPWPGSELSFVAGLALQGPQRDMIVAALRAAPCFDNTAEWFTIDTAPRDGRRLLGTGGGLEDTVEVISYNDRVGAWNTENYTLDDRDDDAEGYNRPSHWRPMPSAVSRPHGGDGDERRLTDLEKRR